MSDYSQPSIDIERATELYALLATNEVVDEVLEAHDISQRLVRGELEVVPASDNETSLTQDDALNVLHRIHDLNASDPEVTVRNAQIVFGLGCLILREVGASKSVPGRIVRELIRVETLSADALLVSVRQTALNQSAVEELWRVLSPQKSKGASR